MESPIFIGCEENIVTKDEEKAEYLKASLPQSLLGSPIVMVVPSFLNKNTGTGREMTPITQGEMVSSLLLH